MGRVGVLRGVGVASVAAVALAAVAPVASAAPSFRDVDNQTPHYEDVLWLADSGISAGWSDGTFRGMEPVTRQNMAAFLHRLTGSVFGVDASKALNHLPVGDAVDGDGYSRDLSGVASWQAVLSLTSNLGRTRASR